MSLPVTKRYAFHYLSTSTGLTPAFVMFKKLSDFSSPGAPSISELSNGWYYFDYTWNALTDSDIAFLINGNNPSPIDPSVATFGTISVQDVLLDFSINDVNTNLLRSLGMNHENSVLDLTTFDGNNNLLSGRLRLYNSKTNADAAIAASPGTYDTGKIGQYSITATYTGANLLTYEVGRSFP